jgi:hypothetical protein
MTIWVVRKSLEGNTIGAPYRCAKPGRLVRVPGLLTVEEQIAILLAEGETVQELGAFGRWQIVQGSHPTGFIEVLDENRGGTAERS